MPDHESTIGLTSDPRVRWMIQAWFELETMKASRVPSPRLAGRLKTCEERVCGAVVNLASDTMSESLAEAQRTGGPDAVSALWMDAVARGEAETVAALAELWDNIAD
jgi:hypothetical protein